MIGFNFERFLDAQKDFYHDALIEVRLGRKKTHWMWFVFPNITGMGLSEKSVLYSIKSLDEARLYLGHVILGERLIEISNLLLDLNCNDATSVFGTPDDLKLQSCMTLFDFVSQSELNPFLKVLNKFFQGKRCQRTLEIIRSIPA